MDRTKSEHDPRKGWRALVDGNISSAVIALLRVFPRAFGASLVVQPCLVIMQ